MITNLAIRNYALIDDVSVKFNSGLTIITGETGAGKSILLGALSLLLGKRADPGNVKDASRKCIIEAHFSIRDYDLQELFEENDLDHDPLTIVRREILPGGKSRAFVNDTPVTLAQLQALGVHLVDIHSQHETLTLSSEAFQLEVIDALAGNRELLISYREYFERVGKLKAVLDDLKAEKEASSRELDYNTFLYNELKEAALDGIDLQDLEETYEKLNNTEEIQESLSLAIKQLTDVPTGSLETAKEVRAALARIKGFSVAYNEFWERLHSAIIELEDLQQGLVDAIEELEADPQLLIQVNEKLQTIHKLQQKHTVAGIAELISIRDALEGKIDATHDVDGRISETEKQLTEVQNIAIMTAEKLHQQRLKAIPELKSKLEAILRELGLPNARFNFELELGKEFRKNGMSRLELQFTANKGLPFGPLKKIASGGEMSRIMLAVKSVLADYKRLPTIIFDEIDTGVSGEIANKMAAILGRMSKDMQLLSITHLPQIAAKGDHHIKVFKEDIDNITVTRLKSLESDDRIVEIAKMIGGDKITEAALANARELLN